MIRFRFGFFFSPAYVNPRASDRVKLDRPQVNVGRAEMER